MGVIPEKPVYGISSDICYSYPCQIEDGEWKIVENLNITDESLARMRLSEKELLEELEAVEEILKD